MRSLPPALFALFVVALPGATWAQGGGSPTALDSSSESAPAGATRLVVVLPLAKTQWSVAASNGNTGVAFTASRWRAAFRGASGEAIRFLHASNTLTPSTIGGQVALNFSEAARASSLFTAVMACVAMLNGPLPDALRLREPFTPGAPFVSLTLQAPAAQPFMVPRRTTTPLITVQIGAPAEWQLTCASTYPTGLDEAS